VVEEEVEEVEEEDKEGRFEANLDERGREEEREGDGE
jgi:hypothetical protein